MDSFLIPFHGVALDGHAMTKATARADAAEWLAANDHPDVDLEDAEVARAWWAGETVGFCGDQHPDAQPVTVVAWNPPTI